jgi:hypothetical protein
LADADLVSRANELVIETIHSYLLDRGTSMYLGSLLGMGDMFILGDTRRDAGQTSVTQLIANSIAKSTLAITSSMLTEFETLIAEDHNEGRYQAFLADHPAILDPLAARVIPLQVMGEDWKSDFVLQRLDGHYMLVEIEKPRDHPLTTYPHPSAALSHALGQVLNWFVWLEDNIAYAQSHGFPEIHMPTAMVVIGRDRDLSLSQRRVLRALNDSLSPRIVVRTYDDIVQSARTVLHNLTSPTIPDRPGSRRSVA